MAYTAEQLELLVREIATEVHKKYPTLQLPDDLESACKNAAGALGRGRQNGLDILSSLQKRKLDAVTLGALEVFCLCFVDAEVSVRARMLVPKTMCYILGLMGDTGAHAPSVSVAGVKLLCCLIGGQQAQTLESFMTPRCLELVMQYLKAGTPLEWVRLALEVVVTTSNCSSGRQMLLELDIAGHLHGCLEAAKAVPEVLVFVIGALWHLYGVCSPFDDLRALELVEKLVRDLESRTKWELVDDLRLALVLRCMQNLKQGEGTEMLDKIVRACAGILTLAPRPSNVMRQILALVMIARISCAPTSAACEILDPTHDAYETIATFFNKRCQVQDSEQLRALLSAYVELAQTMVPETLQHEFLVRKVLLHVLNTIARTQMFTESAKGQLLQTVQKPSEAGVRPHVWILDNHEKFVVEVLKWHGTGAQVVDAGLTIMMQRIIPDEERLGVLGAKNILSLLLNFNQKHLQYVEICTGIAGCLQKLMDGVYAQGDGVPADLREQFIDFLTRANFLLLRQLGTGLRTNDLLVKAVRSAADMQRLLNMNGNAGYLKSRFKCSMFDTDRTKAEAEAAFIYFLLLQLVAICKNGKNGGFRPPPSMVTAVNVFTKESIDKLAEVLQNSCDPEPNAKLFLWCAVVFVCGPAKAEKAKEVEEVKQVLEAQEVARLDDPAEEDESLRLCKKSLRELLGDIDTEAKKRLEMQEALIAEEEQGGPAENKKKKKNRKKKQGTGAAAAQQAEPEAGAAEEVEVVPAPAPASKDEEQERRVGQKKKIKNKQKASGAARDGAAPAPAAAACEPGDKTTLPSPPRAPSDRDADGECVVCLEHRAQFALVPCGHVCLCKECAQQQVMCPLCRKPVSSTLRVFFPASR